ncbi:L-threonine aldolase [Roseibium hamelinense]|uniref:L-threonine aldolase n=1 Tax=Roseibium hamelinense TaxID=150831 RepID=A0A562SLS1_9HYPH|nr:low specificity L-threonine aldolase [Roseibium hamelinense]MTI45002.1 low specificity L-threonine aldolase [Roseibium hamelinense]TWI82265.1 L-threonine aldolase [Roseibium hamelinense]
MNFASDNWFGASQPVMETLARHNLKAAPAYGADAVTESVTQRFSDIFEREVSVFFVGTGSVANALALAAYARPGGAVFCHRESHINVDECNCPEFMSSGSKLIPVPGHGGKITPAGLREALESVPPNIVHHGQAVAVSITQATESGTIYSVDEIAKIKAAASARSIALHMDGARFANALVSLNTSPADMTWKSGVDVLSFGATKNGCWCAEAVVFFDLEAARGFEYHRKRAGHLFSKSRFIAAQFEGYLENDHWLKNARHANEMALLLAEGLRAKGVRTVWPVEANEVFPIMDRQRFTKLQAAGAMIYEWPLREDAIQSELSADELCIRMVTSFATTVEDVARFLDAYGE